VIDFFRRMMGAYYGEEGRTEPGPEEWSQRVLGAEEWARCEALLAAPDAELRAAAARASGVVSLYALMLHGETRDGNFEHGPYRTAGGGIAIANDFNDLRNQVLPWSTPELRLPIDNLCVVTEYDDVAVRFNMFGGAITDPPDPSDRIRRLAVFTREGERLRPLEPAELGEIAAQATANQLQLYQGALDSEPLDRARHGIFVYANYIKPFADLAGAREASERFEEEWRAVGDPYAAALVAQDEKPRLWVHLAALEERMFSPLDRQTA
jgi:hypothetical protein